MAHFVLEGTAPKEPPYSILLKAVTPLTFCSLAVLKALIFKLESALLFPTPHHLFPPFGATLEGGRCWATVAAGSEAWSLCQGRESLAEARLWAENCVTICFLQSLEPANAAAPICLVSRPGAPRQAGFRVWTAQPEGGPAPGLPRGRRTSSAPSARGTARQRGPASERRGLRYAMRRKRPAGAAVAREVSVATEMTSDPGSVSGGRCSRCYGNRGGRKPRRWSHQRAGGALGPGRRVRSLRGLRALGGLSAGRSPVPTHRWPSPLALPSASSGLGTDLKDRSRGCGLVVPKARPAGDELAVPAGLLGARPALRFPAVSAARRLVLMRQAQPSPSSIQRSGFL